MKMNSMGAQALLAVLLLAIGTVEAADGEVSFWKKNFTMTCPGKGHWFKKEEGDLKSTRQDYDHIYESKSKGTYYCKYNKSEDSAEETTYYFYVQGKACEHCYEMDANLFMLVIFMDVVWTVFVMMMIYRCTKKKSPPVPHSSKAPPARSGGRGPPVPSPDYEQLNHQTRGQDTYSLLNRTG